MTLETLHVRLAAPAIVGGAGARIDDPALLRPPSIKGMLRFWTRALAAVGGGDFRELEKSLWGSTERQGISVTCSQRLSASTRHELFPAREAVRMGMAHPDENPDSILVRFRLPNPDQKPQLRSVVWAWLHLGSIGRRARRGYGALEHVPTPTDLLEGFLEPPEVLPDDAGSLARALVRGLDQVARNLGLAGGFPHAPRTSTMTWFQLQSLDQVFVGKALRNGATRLRYDGQRGGLEDVLHGFDFAGRPTAASLELGDISQKSRPGSSRLASPMMWRVCSTGAGPVPVMTWAPRSCISLPAPGSSPQATRLHDYLNGRLGFDRSLANATPLFV